MKRIGGIAAIGRVMEGVAASRNACKQHRLFQAALYSSSISTYNWTDKSQWLSSDLFAGGHLRHSALSAAKGIAGTMFFSAAASSLPKEVHAKEPPPPLPNKLNLKNVVLYQYEACPFCNKLRDIIDKLFHQIHPEISVSDDEDNK